MSQGSATPGAPGFLRTVRERWDILVVIALGGSLGSLGRWGVGQTLPHRSSEFPLSTLTVNVLGSFLLGLLMVFVLEVWPPTRYVRPFVGVGIMGGFTTFSTFMLDNRAMTASGAPMLALAYTVATVVTVLLAVAAGVMTARALARLLHRRRHRAARTPGEPEIE